MPRSEFLRRYGWWIALAIVICAFYPRFIKEAVGITVYWMGGVCLLKGAPLIQCTATQTAEFTYPPAFAFLMTPLAPFSLGARNFIWYVVLIGSTLLSFKFSEDLVRRLYPGTWSTRELTWLRALSIVLILKFVNNALRWQAYDLFAVAVIIASLWALTNARQGLAGAGLGFAAAIKATPLIFLPYLLFKRQFVAAAAFVVVLVALSFSADALFVVQGKSSSYLVTWIRQVALPGFFNDPADVKSSYLHVWMEALQFNQSLRGAVARLTHQTWLMPYAERITYAVAGTFAAIVGVLIVKSPRRPEFIGVDGALLLVAMLMLSPMTSRYHYVALVLPYMIIVGAWLRDKTKRSAAAVVLTMSFILATGTSNDAVGKTITDWSYDHNLVIVGALVLTILLGMLIWSPPQLESASEKQATAATPATARPTH